MAHAVLARERFEATRAAVRRLEDVQAAIILEGEEWKPQQLHVHAPGTSDPTAARAIYRVDKLPDIMRNLQAEERELIDYIGTTGRIVEAVRKGLGDKYATVLDVIYIDCKSWDYLYDVHGIRKSSGHVWRDVAFDWIDSLGIPAILRGEYEL